MHHVKAILIKFVMIAVILGIVLTGIFDVEFGDTLLISIVLTIVAYIIGDSLIFRNASHDRARHADHHKRNIIATINKMDKRLFLCVFLMSRKVIRGRL